MIEVRLSYPGAFEIKVGLSVWGGIHPEDAGRAFAGRVLTRFRRKGEIKQAGIHQILDGMFISGLVAQSNSRREWTPKQTKEFQKHTADRLFIERFARALEEGKAPVFDAVDLTLLRDWRKWQAGPLPGGVIPPPLKFWEPAAIEALAENSPMMGDDPDNPQVLSAGAIGQRIKRMGLTPERPALVKRKREHGTLQIVIVDPKKL